MTLAYVQPNASLPGKTCSKVFTIYYKRFFEENGARTSVMIIATERDGTYIF